MKYRTEKVEDARLYVKNLIINYRPQMEEIVKEDDGITAEEKNDILWMLNRIIDGTGDLLVRNRF